MYFIFEQMYLIFAIFSIFIPTNQKYLWIAVLTLKPHLSLVIPLGQSGPEMGQERRHTSFVPRAEWGEGRRVGSLVPQCFPASEVKRRGAVVGHGGII